LCQNPAVAEVDELKIPKATRRVADGGPRTPMIDAALLSGLPEGVLTLLAGPPLTDTRLLELAARWEGLPPAQARMAKRCGCWWSLNTHRPHRALQQDPPAGRAHPPAEVTGMRVLRWDGLGGLIHEYAQVA
jgi:hypothetical protein